MADLRASSANITMSPDGEDESTSSQASSPQSTTPSSPQRVVPTRGKKEVVDLHSIDPKDFQVSVYNEGVSLAIHGPATRLYVKELKALHAIFTKWLTKLNTPGWSVSIKHQDEVMAWYETIQTGEFVPDVAEVEQYHQEKALLRAEESKNSKRSINNIPTISGGKNSKTGKFGMETVTYTVPRPTPGMKLTLKVGQEIVNYVVESVSEWKGSAVEAIIYQPSDKDARSKIVVHFNSWKVWGFNDAHTIRFG